MNLPPGYTSVTSSKGLTLVVPVTAGATDRAKWNAEVEQRKKAKKASKGKP